MDVTFFENQPFYTNTDIQGENFTQEYQLWDIDMLESTYGESSLNVSPQINQIDTNVSIHPNLLPLSVSNQSYDQPTLSNTQSPDLSVAGQSPVHTDQSNNQSTVQSVAEQPSVQPSTSTHPAEIRELRVFTRRNKKQEGKEQ